MASLAYEQLDRRIFAALRFIDSAGRRVTTPVAISAVPPVKTSRNRSGMTIISSATGLHGDNAMFDPPITPLGSHDFQLNLYPYDPALAPRGLVLSLPRDPDPSNSAMPSSIFRPINVALLASNVAQPSGQAAAVRLTVIRADDGRRVEGALVRIDSGGGRPVARGVTNRAGEAQLLIYGLALSAPGAGATIVEDHAVDLDLIVDPSLVAFHDDTAPVADPRRPPGLIDPDDLEARLSGQATPSQSIRVVAGQTTVTRIQWTPS